MHRIARSFLGLLLLLSTGAALADEGPASLVEALRQSKLFADFTLRHETVDDDALARGAAATTLRSALGFETKPFHGWSLRLEAEDVSVVGADDYANGGFGSSADCGGRLERGRGAQAGAALSDPIQARARLVHGSTRRRIGLRLQDAR